MCVKGFCTLLWLKLKAEYEAQLSKTRQYKFNILEAYRPCWPSCCHLNEVASSRAIPFKHHLLLFISHCTLHGTSTVDSELQFTSDNERDLHSCRGIGIKRDSLWWIYGCTAIKTTTIILKFNHLSGKDKAVMRTRLYTYTLELKQIVAQH